MKFDLELDDTPNFAEIIAEQERLEKEQRKAVENTGDSDEIGVDVLNWKMNLMADARKIGNDTQGGWAAMPKARREDDEMAEEEEEEEEEEEVVENISEPEPEKPESEREEEDDTV